MIPTNITSTNTIFGSNSYHNQQRPKSAMKAVFVDGWGGTIVLLPGSHGTAVGSGKKLD